MYLFLLTSVCHQVFDNLPVHQRLSSKEVYFQISSVSRVCDQEIQRFLSNFIGHQRSSSMIFSFFCKTIFAGKITVMCDVHTERLYHCLSLLHFPDILFINIFCKQLTCFCQFHDISIGIFQITLCIFC